VDIFEGFEPGSLTFSQSAGVFLYKLNCILQSHPASLIKQLVLSDDAYVLRAQRQLQTIRREYYFITMMKGFLGESLFNINK
jgi:hypothetical protein